MQGTAWSKASLPDSGSAWRGICSLANRGAWEIGISCLNQPPFLSQWLGEGSGLQPHYFKKCWCTWPPGYMDMSQNRRAANYPGRSQSPRRPRGWGTDQLRQQCLRVVSLQMRRQAVSAVKCRLWGTWQKFLCPETVSKWKLCLRKIFGGFILETWFSTIYWVCKFFIWLRASRVFQTSGAQRGHGPWGLVYEYGVRHHTVKIRSCEFVALCYENVT